MKQQHAAPLVESHVDYLTASCNGMDVTSKGQLERFRESSLTLLEMETNRGNERRPWVIGDYQGFHAGQASFAASDRGFVTRLSGGLAAYNWRDVVQDSTNVSRIDLAVTVRMDDCWRDMSLIHLQEVRRYADAHAPQMRVRRIDGGRHGNTLNIGSRRSDYFARTYDKERESKDPAYANCWRYELEIKRKPAKQIAARLIEMKEPSSLITGHVWTWFAKRGCVPPFVRTDDRECIRGPKRTAAADGGLAWLRLYCRGSLQRLVSRGKLIDVLRALGLDEHVEVKRVTLCEGQEVE